MSSCGREGAASGQRPAPKAGEASLVGRQRRRREVRCAPVDVRHGAFVALLPEECLSQHVEHADDALVRAHSEEVGLHGADAEHGHCRD